MRQGLALLVLGLLSAGCSTSAPGTSVATRLSGRSVRILVGFVAGGGYDLHARVLAPHLGRHLPGNPVVVVQNMPGAGGLVAANHLAQLARPDGLTVGMIGLSAVLAQLLEQPGVQFDVRRFDAIGSPTSDDVDVCAMTKSGAIDLANWKKGGGTPRLGFTGRGSSNHVRAMLLSSALDLPVQAVVGYPGMADVRLAMESGELDGTCVGLLSYRATFAQSNAVIVLKSNDTVVPGFDAVPSAATLVTSAFGQRLLEVLEQLRMLDRYYVAPAGTSPGLLAAYRRAFDETMADPAFRRDAAAAGLEIRPIAWSDVMARVDAVLALPLATRQRIATLAGTQAPQP